MKLKMQYGQPEPVEITAKKDFVVCGTVMLRLTLLALTSILAAQDFTHLQIEQIATGFVGW